MKTVKEYAESIELAIQNKDSSKAMSVWNEAATNFGKTEVLALHSLISVRLVQLITETSNNTNEKC